MRAWSLMLGGMIVWSVHFAGLYALASVFAVVSRPGAPLAIGIMAALTAACLAANALCLAANLRARPSDPDRAWMHEIGALGAAFSCLFVVWQGLAALLSP